MFQVFFFFFDMVDSVRRGGRDGERDSSNLDGVIIFSLNAHTLISFNLVDCDHYRWARAFIMLQEGGNVGQWLECCICNLGVPGLGPPPSAPHRICFRWPRV